MSFLLWYYTQGLVLVVQRALNVPRYALYRSNVLGLVSTLFSAWRRDVSFHTWRGFHPVLALQAFFNNVITRFLGMLVRLSMILFGLGWFLVAVLLGPVLFLAYFLAPLGLVGSFLWLLVDPLWAATLFVLSLIMLVVVFLLWRSECLLRFESEDWAGTPWQERTLARLGFVPSTVPGKARHSHSAFVEHAALFHHKPQDIERAEYLERQFFLKWARSRRFLEWENLVKHAPWGKYFTFGYTPHLDRYSTDLSEHDFSNYGKLDFVGRRKAWDLLTLVLTRPVECNALLIGEPGIGKKTLVHALARAIRENRFADPRLHVARPVLFDLGQVLSDGRSQHIDPKTLLRQLLNEAVYAGNVILVVENIDRFLSPENENDVSDVLHEYLGHPQCRLIGTMAPAAYHALSRREIPAMKFFEPITLEEPTNIETLQILVDHFAPVERLRVVFALSGLETIVDAAERYNWETPFPERAIDLAEETLLYWQKNPTTNFIDKTTVEAFLSMKSGMPMGEVGAVERDKLLNLETLLHERIIGQHEAVRQVAEVFRKARAGLGNEKRPLGSFLFLGPTGVGKTETAKALAAVYFGSEDHMVRLDMSEFQTLQSVADLIGSAEGEDTEGRLTSMVKEHPFSILLLDELEKAHPKVLDLFLQILDEGFVTDGFGHRVNFRNMIIIATSNAGAKLIREAAERGEAMDKLKERLITAIVEQNTFRPEFLNRFDGVVLFNALTQEEIATVTERKLTAFVAKLKEEKKITLSFAPGVVEAIVARGYQPEFGVRSVNRYIADVVEDRLVKKLLSGAVAPGATLVFTPADLE